MRLACYVSGPDYAPALVLLHGLTGQASTWNVVGARFAEHFRVYAVDMRGHGESDRPGFADMIAYPSFLEMIMAQLRNRVQVDLLHAPKAIGAVKYTDRAPLKRECDDFAKVLAELKPGFTETFMTAPSPGIIAAAMLNEHYPNLEAYVGALADALRVEYEAIVQVMGTRDEIMRSAMGIA